MKILTFDIEDWFHILNNPKTESEFQWTKFESRIHKGIDTIFEILEENNVSATFFVLGWIAKKHPEIVQAISKRGFEIGSHTHMHQLVFNQSREEFKNDVDRSIKTLEDITGKKVISFRAPGFSINKKNIWAFEELYNLGIKIDCSVFPSKRSHGGLKSYNYSKPSLIEYNGMKIKEFPINLYSVLSKDIVFSGGGYFRLLPYKFIKQFTKKSDYVMSYFHPRDFDFHQPIAPGLSKLRLFKSYVGIKNCRNKLNHLLRDFKFIDLHKADRLIDWDKVKIIKL